MKEIDDIIVSKSDSIKRCISRAKEDYFNCNDFRNNFTNQDSVVCNIARACEQSIDLANHIVRIRNLGIPKESRDAFIFLQQNGIISPELSLKLQKMVSFRNVAIHEYDNLKIDIVEFVILEALDDLINFVNIIKNL